MKTTSSIFTGGALVEVGAKAAGMIPLWGIEKEPGIAQVARNNGFHVHTADVRQVDPQSLQPPYHLHASPPCQSFSKANDDGEETREDVELAQATVRFVEALLPTVFTLENVSMYRFSESWRLIQNALDRLGYWMNVQNHCNAADFGVPQTRKRMIVRAVRGGWLPPLPQPVPWRGWYQAIEDLLPGLEDSEFAPWQLARMPQELLDSMLVDSAGYPDESGERVPVMRQAHEPANTIVANHARRPMRAFIMPGRVVKMTPRALARFQSIPDDYLLPDNATLAVCIIGNAVPPLLAQRLLEGFV